MRFLALACLALATLHAPLLAQPGGIDSTKTELTQSDRSAITDLVSASKAGLTGDFAAIRRARNALVQPLRAGGVSPAFRNEYTAQLEPILKPLVADAREEVAINALRLAGELGTRRAMDLLDAALKDQRQPVRVMAALQYARAFGTAQLGPTPLIPAHTDPALATLTGALAAEQDPHTVDAIVGALESAGRVPVANVQDLRPRAVDALAKAAGKLAQKREPDFDPALASATKFFIEALSDAALRLPPATLREIGGASGDLVFAITVRLNADLGADDRAALALLADQCARAYYFAAQALNRSTPGASAPTDYKLGDLIRSGDDAGFRREAAKLFVALTSAPFALPRERYENK